MTIYERDARLYDMIYGGDDAKAFAFTQWLLDFLDISTQDAILDMGSGTGSMLIPLTESGYQITGMEPYSLMRTRTQRKASESGIAIDLQPGSFQTLDVHNRYDLIMAMNGPLHYVEPDDLALSIDNVVSALRSGGYFVSDTINFFSIIKNYKHPDPIEFEIDGMPAVAMIDHQVDLDREKWINKVVLFYEDQEYKRFDDVQEMSMYTLTHLDFAMKNTDLTRKYFFSSYEDRTENRIYGGRLIPIYQKHYSD